MKKLLSILLLFTCQAHAEWMLNPYTQRQDYYQPQPYVYVSSATIDNHLTALDQSTAAIQAELDSVEVSTGVLYVGLAAEISSRASANVSIGVATASLRTDLTALALSTGAITTSTSSNVVNTLVKRDASGNFSAGTITSAVSSSAYVFGDGSGLTGMDAYAKLASTQTFTGINTFASSATFSSSISTITFSGWVDIGWEIKTGSASGVNSPCDAVCSAGKVVLGGGCNWAANVDWFRESYPSANNIWHCELSAGATITGTCYAICARVK